MTFSSNSKTATPDPALVAAAVSNLNDRFNLLASHGEVGASVLRAHIQRPNSGVSDPAMQRVENSITIMAGIIDEGGTIQNYYDRPLF
jgi:hypothetical protein